MSKNKVKRIQPCRRQAMHRGKETSTKPKKPVTRRKDFSASGKGKKRKKRRVHKIEAMADRINLRRSFHRSAFSIRINVCLCEVE